MSGIFMSFDGKGGPEPQPMVNYNDGSSPVADSPLSEMSLSSPASSVSMSSSSAEPPSLSGVDDSNRSGRMLAYIEPEDVVGRKVIFDLPPLPLTNQGWDRAVRANQQKDPSRLMVRQLSSPEDDMQSMVTNFTNLSECESVDVTDPTFPVDKNLENESISASESSGQLAECTPFLLDGDPNDVGQPKQTGMFIEEMEPFSTTTDCTRPIHAIHATAQNGNLSAPRLYGEYDGEDYSFVHWNWPLIQCVCKITLISVMIGLLCVAIGLIFTAPRTCEPPRQWWQGGVFYEIFPASFQDSDGDGIGDLRGVAQRLDYIKNLGIMAVRLNFIFETDGYPHQLLSVTNHTNVAPHLGTLADVQALIEQAHRRKMKVVLDFNPVFVGKRHPLVISNEPSANASHGHRNLFAEPQIFEDDQMDDELLTTQIFEVMMLNLSHGRIQKEIQDVLRFWLLKGVDGFYMKYLEYGDLSPQMQFGLIQWRALLDEHSPAGHRKLLLCSQKFADRLQQETDDKAPLFLALFDLIEHHIKLENIELVPKDIELSMASQFGNPPVPGPWILWSIGSVETPRLATRLGSGQSLAALLVQLMLPGSVNIFYGDEICLQDYSTNSSQNNGGHKNLAPMRWTADGGFTNFSAISWLLPEMGGSQVLQELNVENGSSPLDHLRSAIRLRNASTPLFVAAMTHKTEHDNVVLVANYRIRLCSKSGVIVLERFYPRWNSFLILANLGRTEQTVDLSSAFYQGRALISTGQKSGDVVFKTVSLKAGEALIAKL